VPDLTAIPGVQELWALTRGDPAIRVALIDGPAELEHPAFKGAGIEVVAPSWLPRERDPTYPRGDEVRLYHGTWVASVLFAPPGGDVTGIAPGCTGVLVPSLRGEPTDHDPLNLARALECALANGASVVLVEHCLPSRSGDIDDVLKRVLRANAPDGALIVASAGNEEGLSSCFPAALPDVLAVGAYDDEGRVLGFSNWGPEYDGHGIVAPGANILGAVPGGGTRSHKGTSCAAPIVAGVAALLLSLQRERGAVPDPAVIRSALLSTAAPCSARDSDRNPRRCLAGKLDVAAATERVLSELPRRAARAGAGSSSASGVGPSAIPEQTLIFALGTLGYDFETEARRTSFARFMAGDVMYYADTSDAWSVAQHLRNHPADVMGLTWTLLLGTKPIYAIAPAGSNAPDVNARLVDLLDQQQLRGDYRVERVSLPGRLTGRDVRLLSGETVPQVELDAQRGLHGWSIAQIVASAAAQVSAPSAYDEALREAVGEYLARLYFDMANPGRTPAQRALNFAGTNALQPARSIFDALRDGKLLDTIDTRPSIACRPDSECWDVRLVFADPENSRRARDVRRFAVDVGDTVPVAVNEIEERPEPPPGEPWTMTM
jgi:hypothetical protein